MARVYDYWLGGKDNFAADREAAEAMLKDHPGLRVLARQNRTFVLKAVTWAASRGITQFLDLGCGLPASPAVHDAARDAEPPARVVYVDKDPVVVSHVSAIEAAGEGLAVVEADVTDPAGVLEAAAGLALPDGGLLLDLSEPACLVFGGTLSDMDAETARRTVAGFAGTLAPGSAVIISCASFADTGVAARIAGVFAGQCGGWRNHSREDVASFFAAGGLKMEQAAGDVRCWPLLPSGDTRACCVLGGVGVRP
jgi:SAM-dependent methyltransferase